MVFVHRNRRAHVLQRYTTAVLKLTLTCIFFLGDCDIRFIQDKKMLLLLKMCLVVLNSNVLVIHEM
jgi:hypothetical protein